MMRLWLLAAAAVFLCTTAALAQSFDGRTLLVTDGRSDTRPSPLVLVLHGFSGTGKSYRRKTNFDALAQRDGFVVAYPRGQLRRWNDSGLASAAPDDVAYLSALITALIAQRGVDPDRIYIAGHSNGGAMAMRMACARPDLIAGIAVVAMNARASMPCASRRPMPALFVHGAVDPIVPPRGLGREILSVPDTLSDWAARNRCTAQPASRAIAQGAATFSRYGGCAAPLLHVRIKEHGHEWPGAGPRAVWLQGPASPAVDAAALSWWFFSAL